MFNLKVFLKRNLKKTSFLYKLFELLWHYSFFISGSICLKIKYPNLKIYGRKRGSFSKGFRSDYGQDAIINQFAKKLKKDLFFLDIGCNHPETISNSFYLEKTLGFKGIAIDAISTYENLFKKERPNTKFLNYLISVKDIEKTVCWSHLETLNRCLPSRYKAPTYLMALIKRDIAKPNNY